MTRLVYLIKKDFEIDWRQQSPFTGIVLFLSSTIFISYMAFGGFISDEVWNALFWIILLFTSVNAISKSFSQEERRCHYYFFLCKPPEILLSKLIYSVIYLLVIAAISFIIYIILLGMPSFDFSLYIINLVLGCIGLSSTFTMISAISMRASNRSVLMVVLGFPIVIPVLVLAISNAKKIINGFIWMQIQGNVLSLLSIDVIIIVLSFVLFPFTWKS
ncbi:MAG: heme exporter protein CcmB [Bacteroidota bacterium]